MFFRYLLLRQNNKVNEYLRDFSEHILYFKYYENNIITMAKKIQKQYYLKHILKSIDVQGIDFQFRPLIYQLHGEHIQNGDKTDINKVMNKLNTMDPKQICFIYKRCFT